MINGLVSASYDPMGSCRTTKRSPGVKPVIAIVNSVFAVAVAAAGLFPRPAVVPSDCFPLFTFAAVGTLLSATAIQRTSTPALTVNATDIAVPASFVVVIAGFPIFYWRIASGVQETT